MYISLKPDSDGEAGLSHDSVGIGNIDIQKAYSFSGVLHVGMYEDVQGTSAYIMDVVEIAEYVGSAQKVRSIKKAPLPSLCAKRVD